MTIAEIITLARKSHPNVGGVAVINQMPNSAAFGPAYVAICVDKRDGKLCDPRSWDTHETPEAALEDLAQQLQS